MKVEVGSFTPNSASTTVYLNDSSLQIKGIRFRVTKNSTSTVYFSEGFSDGTTNRAASILESSTKHESKRSTSNSITHYEDVSGTTTLVQAGVITDISTAGEFSMNWSAYNATSVDFEAIGD